MKLKGRKRQFFSAELEQKRKFRIAQMKKMYAMVTSQAVSECGRYVFAGTLSGKVFVQDVKDFDQYFDPPSPPKTYDVHCKVFSLIFIDVYVIVGSLGEVFALEWNEERALLSTSHSWTYKLPLHEIFPSTLLQSCMEVTCMRMRPNSKQLLLIGCGNFMCYELDMERRKIIRVYEGHKNFIHDLRGLADGRIFTASEDGSVRFWDQNVQNKIGIIQPYKHDELVRSEMGKYVGALDVSENFLIAGGGPKSAIFHIGSSSLIRPFDYPDPVHVIEMMDDNVFIAGMSKSARTYHLSGDLEADLTINIPAIYSMVYRESPFKFMSLAGCGNKMFIHIY